MNSSPLSWEQPSQAIPGPTEVNRTYVNAKMPQRSLVQRLKHRWNNFSFRAKLMILLVSSAAVPVIAVTQGLVIINKSRALTDFTTSLESDGQTFTDEYIVWSRVDNQVKVKNLVAIAKATRIDLNNAQEVAAGQILLNDALNIENDPDHAEIHKSFQIFTNAQGRSVAQDIQALDLSPVPRATSETSSQQSYRPASTKSGFDLADIPIVKAALSSKKPLSGMELLTRQQIQRLGLEQQAYFELSKTPDTSKPVDRVSLVSIAVQPILVNDRLVGLAIAGSLLNNHNAIANQFSGSYKVPINSVFAQDIQVMGSKTETGETAKIQPSAGAVKTVLETGKAITEQANILGKQYLTHYEPLYDYQKELKPEAAKPVGMTLVARPLEQAEAGLKRQQLISYSIGGGMWCLVGLLAFPIASSFSSPLRRLTKFAGEVTTGRMRHQLDVLEVINRQDEIGILAQELNQMVGSLTSNEAQLQQESEQARLLASITGTRTLNQPELNAVFNQAVEQTRTLLNVDRVLIYRCNASGRGYLAAESTADGLPMAMDGTIEFNIPAALLKPWRTDNVLATSNVLQADLPFEYLVTLEQLSVKANLTAAIVSGDQLFGLLIVDRCDAPYTWQAAEIAFLQQLATQLGLVIDRFTLLKETENLAEEQRRRKEALEARVLELIQEVEPISQGDLTIQARVTEDEIGTIADSYNATVDSLRQIVTQVQTAASQVAETATLNEPFVQELSTEALRQAEEVAGALQRVEEMAIAVQNLAGSAIQAETAAQRAAQTVKEGDAAMNRTVTGMQVIQATVTETAEKVKRLEESSEKIATVVELIKSFAKQTHMLALNASVEASRAGKDGQSFIVIAKEVQALAQQSTAATDEIKAVVEHIQAEIVAVVAAMATGTEQVVTGTQLVDDTRQSLNQITAVSTEIGQLVATIAEATVIQSQTSESVTQTMQDIAALANKTSAEATQVSASFQELRKVAQVLHNGVGQFKV